jgi:hypothetical protein
VNRLKMGFTTVIICASILLGGSIAWGQGIITGNLAGTMQDATGAVVPGAKITVTRPDTNAVFTATSGANGNFSLNDLPVGIYNVKFEAPGFSTLTMQNVRVDSNKTLDLGAQKLNTGTATTTVEVNAAAALLETTQAQISTTFDTQQVANLPTFGGFDELTLLIPGVVATHANNFSNTNGTGFSSNGQRGRSNNFEIDGQSNNDNSVAGPQFFFSNEEAIDQVQVITNNFSAAYGRNMGSVVNYVTKSGTNSIHGSAFYRYSGDFTSSLQTGTSKGANFGFCAPGENPSDGCTVPVVPRYVSNIYGGNMTAPLWKDKIFASGGVYGSRFFENGGTTSSGAKTVLTPDGLATLNTAFPNNNGVAILNQLNPFKLQGNPRATGTPVNKTVTDGVTTVSVPFTQIARNFPSETTDQEYLGRLDFQLSAKDRVDGRYIYQKNPTIPDNPTAAGGTVNVTDITHSIGADWVHTFSPRWINQLRYSFQQSTLAFEGGDFATCTDSTFANCPSSVGLGAGNSTLGLASTFPQGRIVKVGQTQDNATWSFGRHSITFGGEFDYQNSPNTFLPNQNGTFTYTSYSTLLQGIGTASLTQGNPLIPFKENDVAVYFQDDWKVTPEFTANLGLRWEFFQQALNLLHTRSLAQQTGPTPFWNTSLPLSVTTFPSIPQSYRNWEPRVGFAYSPRYNKNLVVRGGFAINVDPGFYNINLNSASSAPVVNSGQIKCTGTASATAPANCNPSGGANFTTVNSAIGPFIPRGSNPGARNQTLVSSNFRQPYAETYTLGVQYQVGRSMVAEVRYSGNHTVGNFQTLDTNPYLLPVATDFPSLIPPSSLCTAATSTLAGGVDIGHLHCGQTNVRTRANSAFSVYNSLQTSLTSRNYHGVTATAAYTYSRTIDNSSEIFGTFGGGNTSAFSQNPLDPNQAERAVSGISFPNVASIGLTYTVPTFGSANGLMGRLINGWQMNTVWVYNSGQPYTDFDLSPSNGSPAANTSIAAKTNTAFPLGTAGDPRTQISYSDQLEAVAFNSSVDPGRPILSNPKAPVGTVGIYTTVPTGNGSTNSAPFLVDYNSSNYNGKNPASLTPVTPSQVHWIANNQYAGLLAGTPWAGSGRNLLRGTTYNNVDFSVFKNTKLTERLTLRLEVDANNVLNRSYYGQPDADLADGNTSFNNVNFQGAQGGGGIINTGTGVRNMTFGGKFLF